MTSSKNNDRKFFVYVQGRFANRQSGNIFEDHPSQQFIRCGTLACADVVVWTGGSDINPEIYGEKCLPGTYFDPERDKEDLAAIGMSQGKFKVGLCRGAQLLNCTPNKGRMWQDVNKHRSGYHLVQDFVTGSNWNTNSVHHQMMIPGPDAELVAGLPLSTDKYGYETNWKRFEHDSNQDHRIDPEVLWYPKTKSLCMQFHPEFGHSETTEYFNELIDRYILGIKTV